MKFIMENNENDEPVIEIRLEQKDNDIEIIGIDKKKGISRKLGYFSNGSLTLFKGLYMLNSLCLDDKGYLTVLYV